MCLLVTLQLIICLVPKKLIRSKLHNLLYFVSYDNTHSVMLTGYREYVLETIIVFYCHLDLSNTHIGTFLLSLRLVFLLLLSEIPELYFTLKSDTFNRTST